MDMREHRCSGRDGVAEKIDVLPTRGTNDIRQVQTSGIQANLDLAQGFHRGEGANGLAARKAIIHNRIVACPLGKGLGDERACVRRDQTQPIGGDALEFIEEKPPASQPRNGGVDFNDIHIEGRMRSERMLGIRVSAAAHHEHAIDAATRCRALGRLGIEHAVERPVVRKHRLKASLIQIRGALIHAALLENANLVARLISNLLHPRHARLGAHELQALRPYKNRRRADGDGAEGHPRRDSGARRSIRGLLSHESSFC